MLTGLRGRMIAAMLLVSAVTLAIAALALLSPLERRLRDQALDSLVRTARAERGALEGPLTRSKLRAAARTLRRAGGADVWIVEPGGGVLYATDPDSDSGSTHPAALRALRTGVAQRGVSGPETEREAVVAVPARTDGGRVAIELRRSLSSVSGTVGVVRNAFVVAAAIGLAVALLVGLLLAGRLVRRLHALRDTALRVADLGPVAEMRSDASRDEVGDLTRAFATMQANLRDQEQARRTFVATASHELRTPLTSLRVMLDTLRSDLDETSPDLSDVRAQIEAAEGQADRLSRLAAELLDLSRIDAGLAPRAELIEVGEVVRSVVAEFDVRLAGSPRSVALRAGDPRWAVADPGAVAQVVRVLLDNALRHSGSDEPVIVAVDHGETGPRVSVTDRGSGVADGDAERIFERFERGGRAAGVPGFGLGLAIARELARRMGGDLSLVRADRPGARFELHLQAAPRPPAAPTG